MHWHAANEPFDQPTRLQMMRGRQWGDDLPVGRVSFQAKMRTRACDILER